MHSQSSVKLAVGGACALATAIGIGRFVYTPILPVMADALGWTKSDAGLVASANFIGYLVGALAAAKPVRPDRQGWWLVVSLLVSALTTAGMAIDGPIAVHMIIRCIGGAASAFGIIFSSSMVLDRLSAGPKILSAIHFSGVGAGIAVSAAIVSALMVMGANWQELWLASGLIATVLTLMATILIPRRTKGGEAAMTPTNSGASDRGFYLIVFAYGLFGFGYVITTTFLDTNVRISPELRDLEAWIWIVFGCAAIPSVALWSWIGSRLGIRLAFAIACAAEAVAIIASVEWLTVSGGLISSVLLGGTVMGITALGLMAARQSAGGTGQRRMGLLTASFATGQMIGPTVAGVMFDRTGSFRLPSLVAGAALAAAAVCGAIAARNRTRSS
jgi:MFS family permease